MGYNFSVVCRFFSLFFIYCLNGRAANFRLIPGYRYLFPPHGGVGRPNSYPFEAEAKSHSAAWVHEGLTFSTSVDGGPYRYCSGRQFSLLLGRIGKYRSTTTCLPCGVSRIFNTRLQRMFAWIPRTPLAYQRLSIYFPCIALSRLYFFVSCVYGCAGARFVYRKVCDGPLRVSPAWDVGMLALGSDPREVRILYAIRVPTY